MDLLDKYLYAVGRQLPRDNKDDILKELKYTLMEMIESEYGPRPSDKDISNVLEGFRLSFLHRQRIRQSTIHH